MESQAITRFQAISKEQFQNVFVTCFQPYNAEMELYRHLVQWKHKHNKYRQFKREDFCYDGFMFNVKTNSHSILYVSDYQYNDRHSRRRLYKMQDFISKHCFDNEIHNHSTSNLILNKTNSKCINTESYVKIFEKEILQEISIIRPTIIICLGCYDVISNLFQKHENNNVLSAIKNIPIIDIPSINTSVNDRFFQLYFEYVYFRKFGWNI